MGDFSDPTIDVQTLRLTRYQDLSNWTFLASDIKSLCKTHLESGLSVHAFAGNHSLPYSTMKRYVQRFVEWKTL